MHLCRMFQKRPPTFNPCFGWPSGWFSQPLDPQHGRVPSSAAVANEESRWAPAVLADPLGNTWIAGLEPSLCGQLGMAPKTHPLRRPTWVVEFWGVNHLKLFPCESSTVFWSTVSSCIFIYLDLSSSTNYLNLSSSNIFIYQSMAMGQNPGTRMKTCTSFPQEWTAIFVFHSSPIPQDGFDASCAMVNGNLDRMSHNGYIIYIIDVYIDIYHIYIYTPWKYGEWFDHYLSPILSWHLTPLSFLSLRTFT